MRIYRLEHKSTGIGPYLSWSTGNVSPMTNDILYRMLIDHEKSRGKHPTRYLVGIGIINLASLG